MHTTTDLFGRLAAVGVDVAGEMITLMRHADRKKYRLEKYLGTRPLELYQSMQPKPMPKGSLLVVVFGNRPKHGVLLGVWRVEDRISAGEAITRGLTKGSFEPLDPNWSGHFHQLRRTDLLADEVLKLEIEWLGGEINWRQNFYEADKPLIPARIRQEPPVPYQGLQQVSMMMSELRIALADLAWQRALVDVKGIYLITDEVGGQQYVGSASGGRGLLGRWRDYVDTGHGGNDMLIDLLRREPGREFDFRFTLLETLPTRTSKREVDKRESYWKIALGCRTFGLNAN